MAESYRGLTIRIGGDTTKLNQALHTTSQAISGTQSSMRKLSDALKLDPTSLNAAQLQVGEFASQASNAATRLVVLNDAMQQVGNEIKVFNGSAATVRQFADSWGNINMIASQARDHYAALTKTLATTYTEFSNVYSEASKMASVKMTEDWELGRTGLDQMLASVKEMSTQFNANDKQVERFVKRITSLQERYDKLAVTYAEYQHAVATETDTAKFAKAAQNLEAVHQKMEKVKESFQSYIASFKGFKSDEVFKYDADNTDLASLAKSLYQMVKVGAMTVEQADKMYDSFARMKDEWDNAFTNVQTANAVEGLHDLDAEAEKTSAKVKSLVDEMVRLSNTSNVAKGMIALKQQFVDITDRGATAEQRLKSILEILSKDGNQNNTFLQREAMRDYAEATEEAKAAVDNINQQLDQYDGNIRKLAAETKSYATETAAANQRYEESATALKAYEGALNQVKKMRDKVVEDNPNSFADNEDYQNQTQAITAMEKVLDQLRARFADAEKEKEKFVQIGEVRELTNALAVGLDKVDRWSKINFKPEVDVSALDGIKKAVDAINHGIYDAQGSNKNGDAWNFLKAAENVRIANAALDDSRKKFSELKAATKNDPTNSATMSAAMQSAQQYANKLRAAIKAYRDQIDSIPTSKIDQTALATGKVTENFQRAKARVDEVEKAIKNTTDQIAALEKEASGIKYVGEGKAQVDDINARIKVLKQNLKELQAQADVALDGLATADNTRRVEEAQTKTRTLRGELAKLLEDYKNLGNTNGTPHIDEAAFMQVVDRIAQAAQRMASEVVQATNEIDSAYRDMRKTVQGSEEDYERLKEAAVEYSQSHITSADTMLEMQALGGQLGVATENLEHFGKIASNLDIATDMDAETIALKLGQISNVLQLDIDGMQGFADALVRLGNNMPAQESAIMAVAQRFGAVAATANFSGDEVLAWSAAIAATGQRSEAAATAISNTVSGIEQAVANGGSDLKQFAAIANMSADEFVNSWKSNPTETLKAFIEGLKTLKDSDESAIAALENMGITSVRQQQTLLNLTLTIENLGKALTMSSNAWEGIDDVWGQSGDAAIEAQRKSEGFSGALAILQNNAQNLAASFGDSLVPLINHASEILEFLTETISNIPDPIKRVIAKFGGLTIVFSTLTPMLNVFNKGMVGLVESFGKATSIGDFLARVTGFANVMDAAAGSSLALGGAIAGPVVAGLAAGLVAFGLINNAIADYNEAIETQWNATSGLTSAMSAGKDAYTSYIQGAQDSARSVQDLVTAINDATEAQSNYADEIKNAWEEIGTSEAEIDLLVREIKELASKSELTAEEQAKLCGDIKTFNGLTGESVHVIDAQNGVLDTSVSRILEMGKAWKDSLEQDQLFNQYSDQVKQIAENEALLKEAQEKLAEADTTEWFADMRDGVVSTSGEYYELKKKVEEYENTLASLRAEHQQTIDAMSDVNLGLGEIEVALNDNGRSLTEYGSFTDEELEEITRLYKSAGNDIAKAVQLVTGYLDELLAGSGDAAQTAKALEEASKAAAKARAEAFKTQATADYNNLKRQLDNEYRAQQTAYNNQYNALKKQLDKVYNAKKKDYDDAYKKLKSQLDKEYKARKKAYDDQLKALKKSQDAEVAAFKKATEARLKEMKKEYEQRVKLLELQYGKGTDDIDERIEALKAETEAEKKAIETRNEADKITELQSAVDNANSRRKRAEAEKALNDYLQELEAERNEASREAEIERLEDQKTALEDELSLRKDQLKEEYDNEVEAYKEKREAELAALQEANENEYNALKDALDDRLALLKEKQDERLAAMKEAQDAQLQSLKDAQTAQLEAMKQSQSDALAMMKQNQQQQLQDIKAANDAKYKAIKNGEDQVTATQDAEQKKRNDNTKASMEEAATIMGEGAATGVEKLRATLEAGQTPVKTYSEKLAEASADGPMRLVAKLGGYGTDGVITYVDSIRTNTPLAKDAGDQLAESTEKGPAALAAHLGGFAGDGTREFSGTIRAGSPDAENAGDVLADAAKKGPAALADELGGFGGDSSNSLAHGMEVNRRTVSDASEVIEGAAKGSLASMESYRWGSDIGYNLAYGLRSTLTDVYNAAWEVANSIFSVLHHSVPEEGPLSDDDKWGGDLVQNIIDGMREREHDLSRQAEKMARVLEDGFNPTLTVDAAYEALDTIGKNRSKSLGSIVESNSAPSITIELNMNLSDVSFRSDADIDRLARVVSQEMAAQASRQLAGRLG